MQQNEEEPKSPEDHPNPGSHHCFITTLTEGTNNSWTKDGIKHFKIKMEYPINHICYDEEGKKICKITSTKAI